jgi:L-alanine-DL-glutamate epimerase-like enolase superfamily enzyme
MSPISKYMSRRSFFRTSATTAAAGTASLAVHSESDAIANNINTNSQPSDMKITDMRVANMKTNRPFLRIDTNQGIYGYGEVRDGSSPIYALMLKSRILGMNPCNVDKIFRKIKQFGYHGRQGGGVSAIEVALWDLAGKAWGVPCWQMLGGKFRDKILVYANTSKHPDPVDMGNRILGEMEQGIKYVKISGVSRMFNGVEGVFTRPPRPQNSSNLQAPFSGARITEKGLKVMDEYFATVRDMVGWEIPIGTQQFGQFVLEDCIKIAQTLDKYNLAFYEDMLPWFYTDQYVRLKNSCSTPILVGEDIYLRDGFMDLFEKQAIAICHPDLATAGGMLETKKIGDAAMEHGIAMALHKGGSIVTLFASVHSAAATENLTALEIKSLDPEYYDVLAEGVVKPIINNGYITVPNTPGLGIELNEDAVRKRLAPDSGYFEPTPEWDNERSHDRLWSMYSPMERRHEG